MLNNNAFNNWYEETDVVVIGAGYAGLAAAIEARNTGASVLVLEKRKACGGNSIMSYSILAVAGSPLQKKHGIEDSPELMAQDMLIAGEGLNDPDLLKIITEQSSSVFQWMIDYLNIKFKEEIYTYDGHSIARVHIPYDSSISEHEVSGNTLFKPLMAKAKKLGIEIRNKTCLTRLIRGIDGAVEGVEIYNDKQQKKQLIRARKGVILATGGFSGDVAFRKKQNPRLNEDFEDTNRPGTTAEALVEAIRINAQPIHLDSIQIGYWSSPEDPGDRVASWFNIPMTLYGVMIHPKTGKRFTNEIGDRKTKADLILKIGQPYIGIVDRYSMQTVGFTIDKFFKKKVVKEFSNLEQLAATYNLPYQALEETINRYNIYVENLKDEEFDKSIPIDAKPLHPPYYAIRLWPKVHYTMGGVKINSKAQVIDINNQPIPHLYAAGEVTGGIHGASRLGGCAVTECLVFGRIAGTNAALEIS